MNARCPLFLFWIFAAGQENACRTNPFSVQDDNYHDFAEGWSNLKASVRRRIISLPFEIPSIKTLSAPWRGNSTCRPNLGKKSLYFFKKTDVVEYLRNSAGISLDAFPFFQRTEGGSDLIFIRRLRVYVIARFILKFFDELWCVVFVISDRIWRQIQ